MKIGIVTFHNSSNYGAVLQSFALQRALQKQTGDVVIVDYDNKFISKGLKRIRLGLSLHYLYYAMQDVRNFKKNSIKIAKFKRFFKNRYLLTERMSKRRILKKGYPLDLLISGSDQIWNPRLLKGFDRVYFGVFPGVGARISYASSFGNYAFDDELYNKELKEYLSGYAKISLREKSGLLTQVVGKEASEVLDPTLLLDANEWREYLELDRARGKQSGYLLVYALNDFDHVISVAERIAEERGLAIYFIGNHKIRNKNVRVFCELGPEEFVAFFDGADYVVTNSFHGTAFSVIFQKQFVSVLNKKSPERAKTFLGKIGLLSRLVDGGMPEDLSEREFALTEQRIDDLRKQSMEYLASGVAAAENTTGTVD